MKKYIPLYIILLTINLLGLSACDIDGDEERPVVGFSQCALDTKWRTSMNLRYQANAIMDDKFDLIVTDGQQKNQNQIDDIRDSLLAMGVKILMVSPNESEALTDVVNEAYKSGIPVILIDRKTADTNYTCFVGASNFLIGTYAADFVAENAKDGASILEVFGSKGASATQDRSAGFNTRIRESYSNRNYQQAGKLFCEFDQQKAHSTMITYLDEHRNDNKPYPDVIYCHNDDMGIGVSHALTEFGYDVDSVLIIGVDGVAGDDGGIKAVLDNVIDVTFLYPDGADEAIALAERILAGDTNIPKSIDLKTVKIDKSNADLFLSMANWSEGQQSNIIRQGKTLATVESQKRGLYKSIFIGSLFLFVMFCLLVHTIKLHIKNTRANQDLNEKNAEINAQKEELETQTAYLNEVNQQLERSREMILGSIRYANTIQTAALPTEQDLNSTFKSFVLYEPKDIVSGDFYWYHSEMVNGVDTHIVGVIDCTGHGVPGAFMSLIGVNLLDQIVKQQKNFSPAKILDELSTSVREALRQSETDNNDGMEAILCKIERFDDGRMMMTYEGAKFPIYHYIKQTGEIATYKSCRRQLGGKFRNIESMVNFEDHSVEIHKGDRLYMSSDGIGDQNNEQRKRYTLGRLVEKLKESSDMTMSKQKDFLFQDLFRFMLGCQQRDDITVLGVEV